MFDYRSHPADGAYNDKFNFASEHDFLVGLDSGRLVGGIRRLFLQTAALADGVNDARGMTDDEYYAACGLATL